jgi:hypothetical protein
MRDRKIDLVVYPNSPISNLPKGLQPLALLVRNLVRFLGKLRKTSYPFEIDGMATIHNTLFLSEPNFQMCYERAVRSAPFDYKIPWRIHQALWAADIASKLPGTPAFIELGTGRGFVMSAVLEHLHAAGSSSDIPRIFLIDSFSPFQTNGVNEQKEVFGLSRYYADSYEEVLANFSEWQNVELVRCQLPDGLSKIEIPQIGFLHIDLNASLVEASCLEILWDRLVPGAIVLLDDYAYKGYDSTYRAMNEVAKSLNKTILTTASGQGIIIK